MEQPIPIAALAVPGPRVGGSFLHRAAAQIIDLVLHNLLTAFVALGVGATIGIMALLIKTSPARFTDRLQETSVLDYVFPLLGYVVYHLFCEGFHGATLGKRLLGLHVVAEDGSPCSLGAAAIRSLAFYVDSLFFGLIALASMRASELRQRYGDKWAHTVVVARSQFSPPEWPSEGRFVTILLSALVADGLLYASGLLFKLVI